MSTRKVSNQNDPVVEDRAQLLEVFSQGEKPPSDWKIGTEHEKFVYRCGSHEAVSYEEPGGIRDLLHEMTQFGWEPVEEEGPDGTRNVIALAGPDGTVSLEPAGQLELSGAPLDNLHDTCQEASRHLDQVKKVGDTLDLGFLGLGMWPDKTREELPMMPKARYGIMRRYMPKVGTLGLDMMLRTCTIQTNLDYSSEADMAEKFRVGLALQPLATALFANSPFTEGRPNGFLSFRSHAWSDTDPDRTGMLPFVFEDGFGYERYADYALDVPMYFVFRDGEYLDAAGLDFKDFLKGELAILPGEKPTIDDWNDHLSTIFPEVRLKSFLEMRGADGGPWGRICALPGLWVGLLYDQGALDAAWDLVRDWTLEEREALRNAVPELGLKAPVPGGRTLADIAPAVLDMATEGLTARARLNGAGDNESGFLEPLREIVESGQTPAESLLERYHGAWDGDVSHVYEEESF